MSDLPSSITESSLERDHAPDDIVGFLGAAVARYGERLTLALSLGMEDTLLYHLLDELSRGQTKRPRVFTLDTGRLPEESYAFLESLRARYSLPIEVYFPDTIAVEALYREHGPTSFYNSVEDRKACCAIRKVVPLGRALRGVDAWMTGLRRAQGPTRGEIERVEIDAANGGLIKLSPLAHIDDAALPALIERHGAAVHPLHGRGYPSIGCAPCTRAVAPGEPARAGRWWWESPDQKECGLHRRPTR